jgi:NHLM bacteriocin system ABC transporter ATP-binding protein
MPNDASLEPELESQDEIRPLTRLLACCPDAVDEELSGGVLLPLERGSGLLAVLEGELRIFARRCGGAAPTPGRLQPLLSLAAGAVAVCGCGEVVEEQDEPAIRETAGCELVAKGVGPVRVAFIPRPQIDKGLAGNPDDVGSLASLVDDWLVALSKTLFPRSRAERAVAIAPGENRELPPGAPLIAAVRVVWLNIDGDPSPDGWRVLPENRSFFRETGCTVAAYATEQLATAGPVLWTRLAADRRRTLTAITELLDKGDRLSAIRLHDSGAWAGRRVADAVRRLTNLGGGQPIDGGAGAGPSSDPLVAVMDAVIRAMGGSAPTPVNNVPATADLEHRVSVLALKMGVRVRRVRLTDRWWRRDFGPLVAFDADRNPLALIPHRGGYRAVGPTGGGGRKVDREIADSLHPDVYSVYRRLPDRALSPGDIVKFAMSGRHVSNAILMILTMSLVGSVAGLVSPVLTGSLFDFVIPLSARSELVFVLCGIAATTVGQMTFQVVRSFAVIRMESQINNELSAAVWDRLLRLPVSFFRKYPNADLAQRCGAINQIRQLLGSSATSAILSSMFSIVTFFVLFFYDVYLALIALAIIGVQMALTLAGILYQYRNERTILAHQSRESDQILDLIRGIVKLRVNGAEERGFAIWAGALADLTAVNRTQEKVKLAMTTVGSLIELGGPALLYAAIGFSAQPFGLGTFVGFTAAYGQLSGALLGLMGAIRPLLSVGPLYERAQPILHTLPDNDAGRSEPGALTGRIDINQVGFRYEGADSPVLEEVSADIQPGEFIALVGPSGSGKSTLLRLLLGFDVPETGAIFYDGMDLNGLKTDLVRRQLGVVLQSGQLMSASIYKNIVGSAPLSINEAWAAAEMVGLADEIRAMPMGMHTVLSEGATTISGGQRQRLMIARALIRRPRILLFDEATSALDNKSQSTITESLDKIKATRIVVAHRLSTIVNADRIYVMVGGRVIEVGNYASLMRQNGVFADLARRQIA